jgi:hypothetical protein
LIAARLPEDCVSAIHPLLGSRGGSIDQVTQGRPGLTRPHHLLGAETTIDRIDS